MNKKLIFSLMFGMIFLFVIISFTSAFNWNNGIISYYKMDETSGSTQPDELNYDDLTKVNTVTFGVDGLINYGVGSGGTDNYLSASDYSNPSMGTTYSINYWFNITTYSNGKTLSFKDNGGTSHLAIGYSSSQMVWETNDGTFDTGNLVNSPTTNVWHMLTIVVNSTGNFYYYDGSFLTSDVNNPDLSASKLMFGGASGESGQNQSLDELGIWDRSLNPAEITELYNSGAGLPYASGGSYEISLYYPENDSSITTDGTIFSTNFTISGSNFVNHTWKNATYYIWESDGDLANSTTVILPESNQTNYSQFIDNFVLGNYFWNVYGCYGNSTFSNCTWSSEGNFTFTYNPFEVNGETYQNSTIMGSYEYFDLNISVIPGYQISYGYLNYNGTRYPGILENLGNNTYLIKKNISIPGVSTTTIKSFHWEIIMQNGVQYNSTTHQQTVYNFAIDDCSVYTTKLLNITLRDEDNQSIINATSDNTTINVEINLYSYDRSIIFLNYSVGFEKQNPVKVCLSAPINNSFYSLDSIIQYSSDTRATEFYNIQNFIVRNSTIPQNITLFELLTERSTEFLITYKDTLFLPVENALIEITRKYVQEGTFKTVEIPKTDRNGQAVGHFVLASEIYKINVIKNGVTLASFDNVAVVCENPSFSQCKINLNAFSSGSEFTDYSELGGISYDMSFNSTTRYLTVSFTTLNGGASAVNLSLVTSNFGGTNQTICSDELTSSAGTLSCYIAESYGNATIIAQLYSDGQIVTTRTYTIPTNPEDSFDGNGIIFGIILMLTIPLMFIGDKIGFMLGIILGVITSGALLLVTQGSLLGIGSSILWLLIVAGIGISRLSKRG